MTWDEQVEAAPIVSLAGCHNLADVRSDKGDAKAAAAITFAACLAETRARHLKMLAWACVEKNARKRRSVLETVRMEIEAAGESAAFLPMKDITP